MANIVISKLGKIGQNDRWSIFLIFLAFLGLFLYCQFTYPGLAGFDPYYHIKYVWLLTQQGFINKLPWLYFTNLRESFVDFHFLFHYLIIPFVYLGQLLQALVQGNLGQSGPETQTVASSQQLILAGKIATATFIAAVFASFFGLLRKTRVKFAFWWTILLAIASQPFIYRINVLKAPAFSLVFFFLGFFLLYQILKNSRRQRLYWWLLILSFIFMWFYGGALIWGAFTLVFFAVNALLNRKFNCKILGASWAGLAAGLVLNPYFPANINFYYVQGLVAGIGYGEIPVGNEWYPYNWPFFFSSQTLALALWFGTWLLFLYTWLRVKYAVHHLPLADHQWKNKGIAEWSVFIISLIALFLFLRSRRFVEFFVPLALLSAAFSVNYFWASRHILAATVKQKRSRLYQLAAMFSQEIKKIWPLKVLTWVIFLLFIANFAGLTYQILLKDLSEDLNPATFAGAGQWLIDHTPERSIVFNTDWDDFPLLFFHNSVNYYLVGLDPTFMYVYNEDLYKEWVEITKGNDNKDLEKKIANDYQSRYVVADNQHTGIRRNLEGNDHFRKVFEDQYSAVYQLLEQ